MVFLVALLSALTVAWSASPSHEIAKLKKQIEANEVQTSKLGGKLVTTAVTDGWPDTPCHKCGAILKECERANTDASHECFGQCAVTDLGETSCVAAYRSPGCYEKIVRGGGAGAEESKARRARIKIVDSCWRVKALKRIAWLKEENAGLRANLAEIEAKASSGSTSPSAPAKNTAIVVPAR